MVWQRRRPDNMVPFGDSVTRCLVRAKARDRSEAAADIERLFGQVDHVRADIKGIDDELAFTTSRMTESSLAERIAALKQMKSVKEVVNVIRILEP